jgi:MerR family transcriptional regulator, thiopeptide resistance regulator
MERRSDTLNRRFYRTGQFARRASVTVRTLRYYDRLGLVSPAQRSDTGYRLYTDHDLQRLQQILALRFLGFSLQEIQACLQAAPEAFADVLAQQKAMLVERRRQLDRVLRAVEETERLVRAAECDWDAVVRVIQVMQMEQKNDWIEKHLTPQQQARLEELVGNAYSDEARENLARRPEFTEADQQRVQAQWEHVATEARRLADLGADPGGPEGQAVAKLKLELLSAFTQGDPEVEAGLQRFWREFRALPRDEQPIDASPFEAGEAGEAFLERAMQAYQAREG